MKVLYAPARQRVPSKAFEWSNGTYSLLLDCWVTLEEDFALLLDFAELMEAMLLLDFAELLLDFAELLDLAELLEATLDDERTLLLDFALELDFALTEEEDLAELLDTLVSFSLDCGVTSSILLDDSSSRGAKLLSSSQAASAKVNARANTRRTDPRLREDDCRNAVTT